MTDSTNVTKINRSFNILIVAIILLVLSYFLFKDSSQKDKLIEREDIICLVAVCISEKGLGDQCFEFEGNISLVSFTKDMNVPNGKRLIIEPSLKACGIQEQGK